MKKVSDIPANRVACYEWKPVDITGKAGSHPAKDAVVCVSVPSHPNLRGIAIFDGEKFRWIEPRTLMDGVTFWCHAPLTPEDLDAEATTEKKSGTAEPDLFK